MRVLYKDDKKSEKVFFILICLALQWLLQGTTTSVYNILYGLTLNNNNSNNNNNNNNQLTQQHIELIIIN